MIKINYNKETKRFSTESDMLKNLKVGLKAREDHVKELEKSLKDSKNEFDKSRLELAKISVEEAKLRVQLQELKDKHKEEEYAIESKLEKVVAQWHKLSEENAKKSRQIK